MAWAFKTNVPTPNLDRRLLFPLALSSPIYNLRDLYSLFVGFQWSTAQMFDELKAYDAWRLGTRFEVPFFLFQCESDVVTLTTLAEEYFEEVEAPTKELALIKDAGPSPPTTSRTGSWPSCSPGSAPGSCTQPFIHPGNLTLAAANGVGGRQDAVADLAVIR